MKKYFTAALLATQLCSCSLIQRHGDGDEPESPSVSTEEASEKPVLHKAPNPNLETEMAKLNSRIEAMETRVDILTSTLEKSQMRASQPIIKAEPVVEVTPSAPETEMRTKYIAKEPREPKLPENIKKTAINSKEQQEVEHGFQMGMKLFQSGKNAEASSEFASLAKQYSNSMLAAHALYWAGEASARSQKWSSAAEYWESIEKNHPRSAYLPEALAGLSRAYDAQGDTQKASYYKNALVKNFPQAPATLNFTTRSSSENTENAASGTEPANEASAKSVEEESNPTSTATKVEE